MRLTFFFLTAVFLQVSAASSGQTVTYSGKNVRLQAVFNAIEQQTGYGFFYNDSDLKKASAVTVELVNTPLQEALQIVLRGQPITYSISGKTIAITQPRPIVIGETTETPLSAPAVIDVSGHIVDEKGQPVLATITIKGTVIGTTTDENGAFELKQVAWNAVLVVTGVNIEPMEVHLNGRTDLRIPVRTVITSLEEVVSKGYYSEKVLTSTGDVSKVKKETIEKQPVINVLDALQGSVPGLYIQEQTGTPGGAITVQIRGKNSIAQGNNPLYVIDGIPYLSNQGISNQIGSVFNTNAIRQGNPLSSIDPSDIESIEVLKDADAISIYGSRGANGVVLITTKSGKIRSGKTRVELNFYTGAGRVAHKLKLLSTPQYLAMRREAFKNDGETMTTSNARDLLVWDTTRYTDFQKLLIGGTAMTNDGQLAISGGNTRTQFLIGGGYHSQGTVFPGDFLYQKASGHISLNNESPDGRFTINFKGNYFAETNNMPISDPTLQAVVGIPDAPPIYDSLGNYNFGPAIGSFSNPVPVYMLPKTVMKTGNLLTSIVLSYEILHGLKLRTTISYNDIRENEIGTTPLASYPPAYRSFLQANTDFTYRNIKSLDAEPQIAYERRIGKGNLSSVFGMAFQTMNTETQSEYATGFANDAQLSSPAFATSVRIVNYQNIDYRYESAFGRIGYDWQEKYLFNFTGRRDGSSRFGPGRQFANFWSAAGAWVFTKENFFRDHLGFLSAGKLRTSYGTSGNEPGSDYQFMDLWSATSLPYGGSVGVSPTRLANADYRWEENRKFEVGTELWFLKNRISFSLSYYRNRAVNQLVGYPLPPTAGFATIFYNLPAIVQNTGLETQLTTTNIRNSRFTWTTSLNLTVPRDKLVAFPGIAGTSYANMYVVGQPFSLNKTLHYTGVDPQTGILQFQDVNKDGTISVPGDLQASKKVARDFYGGFDNSFEYKGFQLDIFILFEKQTVENPMAYYLAGTMGNQTPDVLRRWQKPGDITNVGKFTQDYNSAAANASYNLGASYGDNNIIDGSFIRLKNVALSWDFPPKWREKIRAQQARIYFRGQNLFTLTHFIGLDPEPLNNGFLPPLRMLTGGFQFSF